jgi:hypothetical protein
MVQNRDNNDRRANGEPQRQAEKFNKEEMDKEEMVA